MGLELTTVALLQRYSNKSLSCPVPAPNYQEAAQAKAHSLPLTGSVDLGPGLPETNLYKTIRRRTKTQPSAAPSLY